MIKHIVFFKLDETNQDKKGIIVEKLNNLKNEIDFIVELEVGVNFDKSERAFDISLIVVVQNKKDLVKYATHPHHLPVVEYIKSNNVVTKVVDYEF
jgi:hypothetical protein